MKSYSRHKKQVKQLKVFSVSGIVLLAIGVIVANLILSGFISSLRNPSQAGTITPPTGEPTAQFYTLSEIFTRLTTNATATEGGHSFTFTDVLEGTAHTLTEIYEAIPTIVDNTVKLGTNYLGVDGVLTPAGGTSVVADLFNGKTAHLTADWILDTGTLNLACNTTTFDGIFNLVPDAYDGDGDGTNRWCITNEDDVSAGDVLFGKIAWINGATTTGTMLNNGDFNLTASSTDQEVAAGYWGAGTLAGDADLVSENISNNVNIFGVIGNLVAGYLYGDSVASEVLTSATGNAGVNSYLATNLTDDTVKKGVSYGVGPSTGAYSGYPGSGGGLAGLTQADCTGDWYWFEDGNGDGDAADPNDSEDGICVQQTPVPVASSLSWNGAEQIAVASSLTNQTATGGSATTISATGVFGATNYANMVVRFPTGTGTPTCWGVVKSNDADTVTVYGSWLTTAYAACAPENYPGAGTTFDIRTDGFDLYDNSWIGDWTCTASGALGGSPSWGSFPTSAQVGAGYIALASADCYDGVRDLLPTEASRAVKTGTISATSTNAITTNLTLNVNEWIGQKVLITSGTGQDSYGRIESNTSASDASIITVNSWTGVNGEPSTDSTFAIIYLIPHATYNGNTDVDGNDDDQLNGNNGPLNQEILKNWQGTKLPTASDFFGFCGYNSTDGSGDGSYEYTTGTYTADKTFGNNGGQVGRTDEFLDLGNSGSWEWLSEQHDYRNARVAGNNACSNFSNGYVNGGYRFRAVFRP